MQSDFWHQKWHSNDIGFHLSEANPQLIKHFDKLTMAAGAKVFLPLCGKTLDIAWLLDKGYQVVGVELSEVAIEQLFEQLDITPAISIIGNFKKYSSVNLDIFVGDFFDLSGDLIGNAQAVYDRAALVALPADMRRKYTAHLVEITQKAPQLLICFEYDQDKMDGPPFSVQANEVIQHYQHQYELQLLEEFNLPEKLKGICAAKEQVWLLS